MPQVYLGRGLRPTRARAGPSSEVDSVYACMGWVLLVAAGARAGPGSCVGLGPFQVWRWVCELRFTCARNIFATTHQSPYRMILTPSPCETATNFVWRYSKEVDGASLRSVPVELMHGGATPALHAFHAVAVSSRSHHRTQFLWNWCADTVLWRLAIGV